MNTEPAGLAAIAVDPPEIPARKVADAVREQFGLEGEYRSLVSERDQNFKLSAEFGQYVVKVVSGADSDELTEFQIAALQHLEEKSFTGVPRVIRTVSGASRGQIEHEGRHFSLRIVSWLDGQLLMDYDTPPKTACNLGEYLARLDRALEGFSHPGDSQVLLWDTQRAGELRPLLRHVEDDQTRRDLTLVIDAFDERVGPALQDMPSQVIHNDANNENVLIGPDGRVAGLIDFGDMLRAPRIVELSTAAAYVRVEGNDPLHLIEPLVRGYVSISPFPPQEMRLLYDLIRVRLAMTITLFFWRLSARDPADPYLEKLHDDGAEAVRFLRAFSGVGSDAFLSRVAVGP